MKKQLFTVLLALSLLLVCSVPALAADLSVSAAVSSDLHAAVTEGENNQFTVYTDAASAVLTLLPASDCDLRYGTTTTAGEIKLTLSDTASVSVGPAGSDEGRSVYTFVLKKVSVAIDDSLYRTGNGSRYDATDKGMILLPAGVQPYAKLIISGLDSGEYTVTGAGELNDKGYAPLDHVSDLDTAASVAVKINGVTFAARDFTLLRPTLSTINFNNKASNTSDRTLTILDGVYTYDTAEQVSGDWETVYFQIKPLCVDATVTVEQGKTDMVPAANGWYSQRMSKDCYELTVTVTLEVEDKSVEQEYTVYLMGDEYQGPAVKTFAAAAQADGSGDQYLTVIDNSTNQLYVFLPPGVERFYVSVATEGTVSSLDLGGAIEAGKWYERGPALDGSLLTCKDSVGIPYSYLVHVISGADKNDTDASLRTLLVRSGSKQSTADNVALGFSPEVTDYSFPVDAGDVYLSIAAAAAGSGATVFINDRQTTSLAVSDLNTDAVTEFKVLVVAGDHATTRTYTLTVNGATGLLKTLSFSNLKGLTPAFRSDCGSYTGYTEADIASTYIVALSKNYSSDYVQISRASYNSYGQVSAYNALTKPTQGGANVTASLSAGSNIFRIDVLASADAKTAKGSYYVSVYVPSGDPRCVVSSQQLFVNGKAQTLSAYNIAGNNYLKLRDIAALLDGTVKEMNVGWNDAQWTATISMPGEFVQRGDELSTLSEPARYAQSTQYFTYNDLPVYPLAYNVTGVADETGSNYVMLRDVASLLNFGVTYNASTKSINIDTASKYTPGL